MRKAANYLVTASVLVSLFWLTACERILSGTKKDAVLAFSEGTIDNLLAGLTANDYAVFSRDFDPSMQEAIPATNFAGLKEDLDNEFGNYISRRVDQVIQSDEFYVVVYQAKFEQEESVEIRVAFHANHSIAFLAFDSGKVLWP
jgi:hypothetical protein